MYLYKEKPGRFLVVLEDVDAALGSPVAEAPDLQGCILKMDEVGAMLNEGQPVRSVDPGLTLAINRLQESRDNLQDLSDIKQSYDAGVVARLVAYNAESYFDAPSGDMVAIESAAQEAIQTPEEWRAELMEQQYALIPGRYGEHYIESNGDFVVLLMDATDPAGRLLSELLFGEEDVKKELEKAAQQGGTATYSTGMPISKARTIVEKIYPDSVSVLDEPPREKQLRVVVLAARGLSCFVLDMNAAPT